jgi:hypothetical protein
MSQIFLYISAGACVLTLLVLLFGVGTFTRGGDFNRKYANKIMRLRIIAQAVAVALILLTVYLARQGH